MSSFPNTYQMLFSTLRQSDIAVQISNDLGTFFQRIQPIILNTMTNNEWNALFQKQLENEFKKLQYPSTKVQGPFCSKNIQKFYSCYDCTKNNKYNATTCICMDCFQMNNHKGHNFRLIETTLAVCDCGDAESLDQQCFCSKHKQKWEKEPTICNKVQETFIKEMQFNIYILLCMIQIKAPYTDDIKKKQIFGLVILKKISDFIGKGYINKMLTCNLMASTLDKLFPPLINQDQSSTIIHLLTELQSFPSFNERLSQLILPLYTVKKMRVLVIDQIFKFIKSSKCFFGEKNVLGKVIFQYFHAQSIIVKQLEYHTPLLPNYPFQKISQRYKGYLCFFTVYYHLLSYSSQLRIVQLLLYNLDITQLTLYYVPKLQKSNKEQFYNLQFLYFKVMAKMIKIVIQSQNKQQMLTKIIKNCYQQIKRKDTSPSFSIERTFSLAYFAYIQFDLQNIFDLDNDQILQFFGEQDQFTFIDNINQIIKKSFTTLKLQNFSQFKRIFQAKDLAFQLGPKFVIGIDQIYTKIFINFLLKFDQPSLQQNFKPLQSYINSRKHSLEVLFDLFKIEQICKLQQTISTIFLQISTILNYFVYLSQTSFYELIAGNWLSPQKVKKEQVFQLFQFLTYIYDPSSIKQFKQNAQRYINNDNLIKDFVSSCYDNHKREFSKGKVPNNNFNLSYKSNYVDFKSYKQNNNMYYLKLKKYRRTQISRFIFNSDMINQLIQLFNNIFAMYSDYFKFNQIPSSKIIMVTALQSLILLSLQTKNHLFDQIIQTIIKSNYIEELSSEYSKHIVEIYTQNKVKIEEQKSTELKDIHQKIEKIQPNKKAKDKIAQKMNLIKNQQQKILSKNNASFDQPQVQQNSWCCIICKQPQNVQRLYYLTHTRFSNLAKSCRNSPKGQKINEPMLVISTCGHTTHFQCLKKSLSTQNLLSEQFQFSCFFCKAYSNSLFPIINEQNKQDYEQIQNYLGKYASYILTIMQQSRELSKKINYQSFNLQQMIFHAIAQSIYWYGLHFPKYLITKILPIARQIVFLFKLLRRQRAQNIAKMGTNESMKNSWGTMINFIRQNLTSLIEYENQQDIQAKVRKNFNELAQQYPHSLKKEDLDRFFIIFIELTNNKLNNFYQITSRHGIRQSFHQLFDLPQDLLDLNKQIGKCPTCKKPTSKILICFLCSFKTCERCENQILKHISFHFTSCIFIRAQLGDLYYCLSDDRVRIQSLYRDYAGDTLQNPQLFPQKSKYMLAHDKRNILYEIALDDVIENEMMGSRAQNICQIQ